MAATRRLQAVTTHLTASQTAVPNPNPKGTPPKGPGPAPVVFDTELPGASDVTLSPAEIAHFKEFGWIVKKKLIDPAELAPIRDCIWPAAQGLGMPFDRHDPSSFTLPKVGFFRRHLRCCCEQRFRPSLFRLTTFGKNAGPRLIPRD